MPKAPHRVVPGPGVSDAFITLAQENLNRIATQNEDDILKRNGLRLCHPSELGISRRQDKSSLRFTAKTEAALLNEKYAQLGNRRQLHRSFGDGDPPITLFTSNHKSGVDARVKVASEGRGICRGLIRRTAISPEKATQGSVKALCAASRPFEQHLQQQSAPGVGDISSEDENIRKDLETVLEAFRNFEDEKNDAERPSANTASYDEPNSRLRTSHLSRLATQYYGNASLLSRGCSSRSHSCQRGLPGSQRLASTSVSAEPNVSATSINRNLKASATSDIMTDPPFVRGNATLQPGIGGQNIRQHLKLWQAHHNNTVYSAPDGSATLSPMSNKAQNTITQSGEDDSYAIISREDDVEIELPPQVDEEEGMLSVIHAPKWFKQGDLVEHWAFGEPMLTLFIKNFEMGNALFYTERGSWLLRKSRVSLFSVPGFIDPEDLKDILPFAPSEERAEFILDRLQPMSIHAPREAGAKVLDKMRRFHMASNSLYRKHADRLNRGYEIMAPESHNAGWRTISLQDATMEIMQKRAVSDLTPVMLWTVHRTLCKMQNVITDLHTHRMNPEFKFISKQNLRDLDMVKDWMREFQEIDTEQRTVIHDQSHGTSRDGTLRNPISFFVEKARKAILASRQTRQVSPTGYVGPSSNKIEPSVSDYAIWRATLSESLTRTDRIIIRYMDTWVATRYLNSNTNYPALGPMILRAVGLYSNHDLDESTGFTFLQELGIVSPWQNRTAYLAHSGLPGHNIHHPITVARKKAQRQLTDIKMRDTMIEYRRDWGDLPVYCIDGIETTERDDGVSLEESNGETWVHVHVANPSAFIAPDSAFAAYAAKLSESVYLPGVKYPMVEPKLSEEYFALGPGRPCITFSAKVDAVGELSECSISHGTVHNVHYITPHRLERQLGLRDGAERPLTTLLTVGGIIPPIMKEEKEHSACSDRPLTDADLQTLHKLRVIAKTTQRRRERHGAFTLEGQSTFKDIVSPVVFFGRGIQDTPRPLSNNIQRYDGDPIVSIVSRPDSVRSIDAMVTQLMILAGEVAANWCQKRHVPIPYRGIRVNPAPCFPPLDFKREVIDPQLEKQGFADEVDLLRYLRALGSGDCSASPLDHTLLGLPAYTKATSPLRRYCDLLTHWQIEAQIRQEKETKLSFEKNQDTSYLPFAHEEVEASCRRIVARGGQISNVRNATIAHWYNQALFRAFYFKEAPLPETFNVRVVFKGHVVNRTRAYLLGWGRFVELQDESLTAICNGDYQVGDIWQVRIQEIRPYTSSVLMEPIKLISRNIEIRK
ncbi:MAG: hypothetical protein Q9163_002492 [Psora crenata]